MVEQHKLPEGLIKILEGYDIVRAQIEEEFGGRRHIGEYGLSFDQFDAAITRIAGFYGLKIGNEKETLDFLRASKEAIHKQR